MTTLRILLVDDHEVVLMGLTTVLAELEVVQVVGEARNTEEAISACAQYHPNVVIMDIRMPGEGGIAACRYITQHWPDIQVIMLTSFANDDLIAEAIEAGAVGYVLKQVGTDELMRALDAIRQGVASLDPAVTRRILAQYRHQQSGGETDPFVELTERELAVLKLLAQAKSNAQIAESLKLSEKTVRNHVSSILNKLSAANRVEAATFATRHGIRDYRRNEMS